jgi:heptose-I-phosphate ethanolaminephosphotransferase
LIYQFLFAWPNLRAALALMGEMCFAVLLFLPGFLIGCCGRSISKYVTVFILAATVYFLFAKLAPKFVTVILTIPVILLQVANIGSWLIYDTPFEYGQLRIILDTEPGELTEFVSVVETKIIVILMVALFSYLIGLYWLMKPPLFFRSGRRRKAGAVLLVVSAINFGLFHKPKQDIYTFVQVYYLAYQYSAWQQKIDKVTRQRASIFQQRLKAQKTSVLQKNLDDIIIVVIGESARRSNFGLYGYHRDTTPNLDGLRRELLVFNQAISTGNSTVLSLKLALTPATAGNQGNFSKTLSLVSEARLAGYHTTYISNINELGRSASRLTMISNEADETIHSRLAGRNISYGPKDDVILPHVEKLLDGKNGKKKQFIFLSTLGSHMAYQHRVPAEFIKFKPVIEGSHAYYPSRRKKFVNAYDNSIVFLDWFLNQLITKLKSTGRSATLVYFSDHGERLYEDKKTFGHGFAHPVKLEYDIPLLMWRSTQRDCNNSIAGLTDKPINMQYFLT